MHMMSGGMSSRFPFTASQWQELEHQALIYKYLISGIPIPSDLLFSLKRSPSCFDSSPFSPKFLSHQPQHVGAVGWNCFQMGLGKKIDPEPGRCRRTDGKKWRCSKEAYPDSKYCERHMHRGKNRSRKPVEVLSSISSASPTPTPNASITPSNKSPYYSHSPATNPQSLSSLSSSDHSHHNHSNHPHHSYYFSSRPPGNIALSAQDGTTTNFLLDSSSYSQSSQDYRYLYGLKENHVDEHAFFAEPSGSMRSFSGSSMDDSWQLTPLTMSSSSKQRSCSALESDYSYLQLQSLSDVSKHYKQQDVKCELMMPMKMERDEEEPQKTIHRFFDEGPIKSRDNSSWVDVEDNKSSNSSSMSTTKLSISMPSSSNDFPAFNSRRNYDG
ncbi:hypothetical protein BT93_C0345 [Corymbia citriodora subsp. variegata]|nr:hypothetical protein BT93_C0345 [Corymbia citriodora subsp. variegata]